jgi:hypothetical protein
MLYIEFNIYGETNKKSNRELKIKSILKMLLDGLPYAILEAHSYARTSAS